METTASPRRGVVHPLARIHPKAHVENSDVGAATRIWQFATVIRRTRLGVDCNVAAGANLDGPWIGDRCIISPGVDIGPGFLIGDDCFIGPNVVLCNDSWPTVSKDGWTDTLFREGAFTVKLGNNVSIGANAVILPGVSIGAGAMISANATVNEPVPAGHLFMRSGRIVPIDNSRKPKRMKIIG